MIEAALKEVWTAAKDLGAVITPFAVFWLTLRTNRRKSLLETIDGNVKQLDGKVESIKESLNEKIQDSKDECQEDIRALTIQVSAFQREVAEKYADKTQFFSAINDIRADVRSIRGAK